MKKVILLYFVSFFIFGCSNQISNTTSCENQSDYEFENESDEDFLFYTDERTYLASVDEMEFCLKAVLENRNSEKSRSGDNSKSYNISQVSEDYISVKNYLSVNRNVDSDECDSVSMYLYSFENPSSDKKGFAITSTDRRVGLVLAAVDEGQFCDNELCLFITELLSDYVENSVKRWALVSEKIGEKTRSSYAEYGEKAKYSFGNFKYNSGNLNNLLVTKWDQHYPFNEILNKEKNDGKSYVAGCVPIAIAQAFCILRPFTKCSLPDYLNISYDWDEFVKPNYFIGNNKYAKGFLYDSRIQTEVAALVYEIGLGVKTNFGTDSSGSNHDKMKKYFNNIGLQYSHSDYSYKKVVSSIENGSPVIVGGHAIKDVKEKKFLGITFNKSISYKHGHEFVIDGYANYSCDVLDNVNNKISTITTDFVHVNYGWDSLLCDGMYLSGLFNTNLTPLNDLSRSGTAGYYKYNLKMFYNMKK